MQRGLRVVVGVAVVALAVGASRHISAQAPQPEVTQFGPQLGEVVPAFSLVDQFGERHDLQSLMGPNGLLLEFNRSSDW